MTEIKIPFREDMAELITVGRKKCTTRTEKYGDVGDTFPVKWKNITTNLVLTHVEKKSLSFVAQFLHDPEGFENATDFVDIWNEIHPRKGFDPKAVKWVHWFEMVK
jgi:hypothetical protein